jgi:Phage tail lysozyme
LSTLAERQAEFCGYFAPVYPMRSAAAIGGNATQENMCQPVTTGAKDHGSDGTLQWRLERLDGPGGLKAFCAARGLAWNTLKAQAAFTMFELDNDYPTLKGDLRLGLKSLETLTLNFCDIFERPSTVGREADKRIAYAHDCLTILMRDAPSLPHLPSPTPTKLPGVPQMPASIEIALLQQLFQILAPLVESAVAGFVKGHVSGTGGTVSPAGMVTLDPAALVKMIEDAVVKHLQPKPA